MPIEAHDLVTLVPLAIIGITGIVRWALQLPRKNHAECPRLVTSVLGVKVRLLLAASCSCGANALHRFRKPRVAPSSRGL